MITNSFAELRVPQSDPYADGSSVTGVFAFNDQLRYEFETRTERFVEASGVTSDVADTLIDWLSANGGPGDSLRQVIALDIGSGAHAVTLDLSNTAAMGRWGDSGNGGTMGDATGESVHDRLSVLDRYFQTTRMDSTNTPILEIAEYSEDGRYAPLSVIPEQPVMSFDAREQTTVFDIDLTLIEVASIDQALDTTNQKEG
jgi:hypothetical protein